MRSQQKFISGLCWMAALYLVCTTEAKPLENQTDPIIITDKEPIDQITQAIFQRFLAVEDEDRGCSDSNDDYGLNEKVDEVLILVRTIITDKKLDRVPLPNFEEEFSKKIGFIKVKGSFKGEDGWVESMASIARKGDVVLKINESSAIVQATFGLDTLQLGMRYSAKLSIIKVSGDLDAKVRSNAIAFEGGFDFSTGKCRVLLNRLEITDLGKIDVHVSGLGKLNWLYSKIVTWITSRIQDKLRNTVQDKVKEILAQEMAKINCPL